MSALILYCAASILHVLHGHAPDLIHMVVLVSQYTGRCHTFSTRQTFQHTICIPV